MAEVLRMSKSVSELYHRAVLCYCKNAYVVKLLKQIVFRLMTKSRVQQRLMQTNAL